MSLRGVVVSVVSVCTAAAGVVLVAPAPAFAATWTQIASGTASQITAIEYQSSTRFWFTTADGSIYKRGADGTFTRVFGPSAIRLNDIEFQSGGNIGLAVGDAGQVLRSTNAGDTWTSANPVGTPIPVSSNAAHSTFSNCALTDPLGTVNSVRFAGNSRVWIFAEGSQMAKSEPANAAMVGSAGTWVDANRIISDNTCKVAAGQYNEGLADAFFAPTNPDVGWIVQASFSTVYSTVNDLATAATTRPAAAGNAGGGTRTLAGDPASPSRMWSVNPQPYGISTTAYTEDGFSTSSAFKIGNPSVRAFPTTGPYDVDFAGGTVVAVGDAGLILDSKDGETFYYSDAAGALATENWRAVSVADANNVAIGGVGGVLAVSTDAGVPGPPAPPGDTRAVPTLSSAKHPPVLGGGAVLSGAVFKLKVSGRLGVPEGVSKAAACNGKMTLSVYKGKKKLATKKAKVKSTCKYATTLKLAPSKVGGARKLKLQVAFPGNIVLAPVTSVYKVSVKR